MTTYIGGTFALYSSICGHAKVSLLPNQQTADESLSTYKLKQPPESEKSNRSKVKMLLEKHKSLHTALLILVLLGTCMVIGDGLLTPAISGIKIAIFFYTFCNSFLTFFFSLLPSFIHQIHSFLCGFWAWVIHVQTASWMWVFYFSLIWIVLSTYFKKIFYMQMLWFRLLASY